MLSLIKDDLLRLAKNIEKSADLIKDHALNDKTPVETVASHHTASVMLYGLSWALKDFAEGSK